MDSFIFISRIIGPVKENYSPKFLISKEILGEDLDKSFLEKTFGTATENLFSLPFNMKNFSHVVWSSQYKNGETIIRVQIINLGSDQRFKGIVNLQEIDQIKDSVN